jgi:hypothetical protein
MILNVGQSHPTDSTNFEYCQTCTIPSENTCTNPYNTFRKYCILKSENAWCKVDKLIKQTKWNNEITKPQWSLQPQYVHKLWTHQTIMSKMDMFQIQTSKTQNTFQYFIRILISVTPHFPFPIWHVCWSQWPHSPGMAPEHSDTRIMGSNPARGTDICPHLLLLLCCSV